MNKLQIAEAIKNIEKYIDKDIYSLEYPEILDDIKLFIRQEFKIE